MKFFWITLFSSLLAVAAAAQAASKPPATVTAIAVGAVPGTIVCHDLATVQTMFDWYAESWEERMEAALTHGGSEVINGPALQPPRLSRYGCALAKPGTRMTLHKVVMGGVAFVTFKLPTGKWFSGVTQANMVEARTEARAPAMAAENAANAAPPKNVTPPKKVTISAETAESLLLEGQQPVYPPSAKAAGVQGTVVLQATISTRGAVIELKPVSGPDSLVQSAMDAVRRWRFRPYLVNGQPVDVQTTIGVSYVLGPR